MLLDLSLPFFQRGPLAFPMQGAPRVIHDRQGRKRYPSAQRNQDRFCPFSFCKLTTVGTVTYADSTLLAGYTGRYRQLEHARWAKTIDC